MLDNGFHPTMQFTPEEIRFIYNVLSNNTIPDVSSSYNLNKGIIAKLSGSMNQVTETPVDHETSVTFSRVNSKPDIDNEIYGAIYESINKHQSIEISYDSIKLGRSNRIVDPYSLVFRKQSWYLVGYCHLREEIRTFRFSKIHKAKLLDRKFRKKFGYSLKKYLNDSRNIFTGEVMEFTAEFKGEAAESLLTGIHHPGERIQVKKNGVVLYSAKAIGTTEILRWLMGFGNEVKVLSPSKLIDELKRQLIATLEIYNSKL